MLRIDVLALFPAMLEGALKKSIIKRARQKNKVKINVYNLRNWSKDKHKKVDDRPFGGGPGMVLIPQPIFDAVKELKKEDKEVKVILLTPQGKKLNQKLAGKLAKSRHLILICGHYEGVDERVRQYLADDEISIGDYVLTCGEIPALVLIDSIVRLLPGVLGHQQSNKTESFQQNLLEYPQYTRPAVFRGKTVPEVLISGDHNKIEKWRKEQALIRTKNRRPDLLYPAS